eukprot:TRINITY_DN808_c0_g1_i1.p1 TRINITY_DN808_c0_g1~~TRINITY_DN808_c0_g1_i1.p1  ORF type:complete len:240 (+),score=74.97 TRINITY_DN808_c0_g1_i1:67-786(+)
MNRDEEQMEDVEDMEEEYDEEGDEEGDDVEEMDEQDRSQVLQPVPMMPAVAPNQGGLGRSEYRKIPVPPHRISPLKQHWENIYTPIVTHLKLQIRMNTQAKAIEIRTSPHTEDIGALQRAADFVQAFCYGFNVEDAVALLRLDDLYIESFQVEDVKMLAGDNLSRAIGRLAGKDGRTKFTIENVTRTRIVIADKKIHILGSFGNIKLARDAVCDLILGSPPGKVYAKLKVVASRAREAI